MALTTEITVNGMALNALEERRVQRQLDRLGTRLQDWPDPTLLLNLDWRAEARQAEARLRVRLGHLGPHLISVSHRRNVRQGCPIGGPERQAPSWNARQPVAAANQPSAFPAAAARPWGIGEPPSSAAAEPSNDWAGRRAPCLVASGRVFVIV